MPRKAKIKRKFPIVFRGVEPPIEYVDKTAHELRIELQRVHAAVATTQMLLSRLPRALHPGIKAARFQLANMLRDVSALTDDEAADELARLNYCMEDALALLNMLSDSKVEWLEKARFELTFGQTPRKRELIGTPKDRDYDFESSQEEGSDYAGE